MNLEVSIKPIDTYGFRFILFALIAAENYSPIMVWLLHNLEPMNGCRLLGKWE
nr:hypothetical protein Q903MT_gene870 [Picea sitchensis]